MRTKIDRRCSWFLCTMGALAALESSAAAGVWSLPNASPRTATQSLERVPQQWTGKTTDGGVFAIGEDFASVLAGELANVELGFLASRDADAAMGSLALIQQKAAYAPGFPGQEQTLVDVAEFRARLQLRLERLERAEHATGAVLPSNLTAAQYATGLEMEPADARLAELELQVARHPKLVAVRQEIEAARSRKPELEGLAPELLPVVQYVEENFGPYSPAMTEHVEALFRRGDTVARGMAPALAFLTLRERVLPGSAEVALRDPLVDLLRVDQLGGLRLIADHLEGNVGWRMRIAAHMGLDRLGSVSDVWGTSTQPDTPPQCLRPEWAEIFAFLLEDSRSLPQALSDLDGVLRYGGLTERMINALELVLRGSDERLAAQVAASLKRSPSPSAHRLYVAALEHPQVDMRRFGASMLAKSADARPLLKAAGDSDAVVRAFVARALGERQVVGVDYSESPRSLAKRNVLDPWGPEAEAALAQLVGDVDPDVRQHVGRALAQNGSLDQKALFVQVLGDSDPRVRFSVAMPASEEQELQTLVLETLAMDRHPDVVGRIDQVLSRASWDFPTDAYLAGLEARFANLAFPPARGGWHRGLESFITELFKSREGAKVVLDWAAQSRSHGALKEAWRGVYYLTNTSALADLTPSRFAGLLGAVAVLEPGQRSKYIEGARQAGVSTEHWIAVCRDRTAPIDLRLQALSIPRVWDKGLDEALEELLRGQAWGGNPIGGNERNLIHEVALPVGDCNERILRWLADETVADVPLREFAVHLQVGEPGSIDLAHRIIERWGSDASDTPAVSKAMSALANAPTKDVDFAKIERVGRNPAYERELVEFFYKHPAPLLLPLVGSVLLDGQRDSTRVEAAYALARDGGQDALGYLVQALPGESDARVQAAVTTALGQVEQHRNWRQRIDGGSGRDAALEQVLAALGDDSEWVRAQAAKSLVTLDVADAIPRLLGMLKDKSEVVRKAANEALDTLHARATK